MRRRQAELARQFISEFNGDSFDLRGVSIIKTSATITGTGMAVPPRVVTNDELAKMMDTSDEWIRQRTGIEERRWITDGITPSDLALEASQKALKAAGLQASDLDYILVATLSPEAYFPGTCSFLQAKLGVGTLPGLDLRAQCSGFIYGLDIARALVNSGQYRRVLLVGVEVQSVALEKNDRGRDMAVLFGDGAGAAIIEPAKDPKHGILHVATHLEGMNAGKLQLEYPSSKDTNWITPAHIAEGRVNPKMDGKFVFKNAVTRMPEVINEVLTKEQLKIQDIQFWLFHQANLRINEHIAQTLEIPSDKIYNNIQRQRPRDADGIWRGLHLGLGAVALGKITFQANVFLPQR